MANNANINKVQFGDTVLIDLTNDTIASSNLIVGYIAHDKSGSIIGGGIPTRTSSDLIFGWSASSPSTPFVGVVPGYYPSTTVYQLSDIQIMPIPNNSCSFTVAVPNNTANPNPNNSNDWINTTFTVDSSGNSTVANDILVATGVSF